MSTCRAYNLHGFACLWSISSRTPQMRSNGFLWVAQIRITLQQLSCSSFVVRQCIYCSPQSFLTTMHSILRRYVLYTFYIFWGPMALKRDTKWWIAGRTKTARSLARLRNFLHFASFVDAHFFEKKVFALTYIDILQVSWLSIPIHSGQNAHFLTLIKNNTQKWRQNTLHEFWSSKN